MVIFYTIAYNAERTLPRTIQSVLDQTEPDWIWYLVDNGSQDATGKTIDEYAAKDARIISLRNEINMRYTPDTSFFRLAHRHEDTDWFCFLDADDTYYAGFLEHMLAFAAKYDLDVAACGSDFIEEATGEISGRRILTEDLILTRPEDFGMHFPVYYQFMRTNWAKLFSIRIAKRLDTTRAGAPYGGDTLYTQEMLRHAGRFGILAESLHRYYHVPKSMSRQWNPRRFESDKLLYRMSCSFLTDKCGAVSAQNRWFLQGVYSYAVADTANVVRTSGLSPADKLREYRAIAGDPLTRAAYRECTDKSVHQSRSELLRGALQAGAALDGQEDRDLCAVLKWIAPDCAQTVSADNAALFLEEPELLQALLQNDPKALLEGLLTQVEQGRSAEKYAVPHLIRTLAADDPVLCRIDDGVFLQKYAGLYRKARQGEYLDALDEMTGLLLENKVSGGEETFLQLFISLAAMEDQAPAFIFGKLQLAIWYLHQDRKEPCRALVDELAEMGVGDETLADIRAELDA